LSHLFGSAEYLQRDFVIVNRVNDHRGGP
jgi:hypothetical protein